MTTAELAVGVLHEALPEESSGDLESTRTELKLEFASFLHDTVLQTLGAIAADVSAPRDVRLLAMRQDAELRAWMRDVEARPSGEFGGALRALSNEIARRFNIYVDVVTTVTCPMTRPLSALLLATREAIINAAKHSGQDRVDVYASRDRTSISVWVRDRGAGFDPDEVATDRRGIEHSIHRRLAKVGGGAEIASAPCHGTVVELNAPVGR